MAYTLKVEDPTVTGQYEANRYEFALAVKASLCCQQLGKLKLYKILGMDRHKRKERCSKTLSSSVDIVTKRASMSEKPLKALVNGTTVCKATGYTGSGVGLSGVWVHVARSSLPRLSAPN
ncbi:hypothetical protein RF11_03042 [Thelohanellus kitauei]|uniref:Uncharacterized protein n=1 Tax=Thelohanellus kitauei TaxID=669202 RepID=A0A0C2N4K8_THEKT|nr:hypothetical protein RF11_03042 [Thelohanellus kitauei]